MKSLPKLTRYGLVLSVIGLLGLTPAAYYRWIQPHTVKAHPTAVTPVNQIIAAQPAETVIAGHPNLLEIPSLKMSLKVTDGTFNEKTGQWTLSLDHAHFAAISAQPNTKLGNTFIYGHYRPEVFARLHTIRPNSEAVISTDNGYRFVYNLQNIHETSPNDTSIFGYDGPPELTIQTCSGAWFQNRQLYTFSFVRYEKA